MRLNIKATNIALHEDIREYLNKRLQSLRKLINLEDEVVLVAVELGRTTRHHQAGPIFRAEINIYRGSESFRATAQSENLSSAIDKMRDEIARELVSHKDKQMSFIRRGGLAVKEFLRGGYAGLQGLGRYVPKNLLKPWKWYDTETE